MSPEREPPVHTDDDQEQCGGAGPGGLVCTRLDGHDGSHVAYPEVGGRLQHVEWFECNPIGEPVDDGEDDPTVLSGDAELTVSKDLSERVARPPTGQTTFEGSWSFTVDEDDDDSLDALRTLLWGSVFDARAQSASDIAGGDDGGDAE